MNENKRLFKNTIVLGIGQFIPKLIAIVTLPIITNSFTTVEYGIYELIISFSSLSLPIITLLIQQAAFRLLIEKTDEKSKQTIITNSFAFVFTISNLLIILFLLISLFLSKSVIIPLLAILLYVSEAYYDLSGQISRALEKNTTYSIASIIYSLLFSILVIISYYTKIISIKGLLLFSTISYFLAFIFIFHKLNINTYIKKQYYDKPYLKKMLKYSFPIIPSSISLWIVNLSDRLIITIVKGASLNGIYSAACKIPNLFGTVYGIFNLAWTESASRVINRKDITNYYSSMTNSIITFFLGCLMIIILVGDFLFNILIDSKFNNGIKQLPILYIGIVLSCLVSYYGSLYIALKQTKKVGVSSLIGSLLNIFINICFINKYGLYAASLSTAISFFIILLFRIIDIQKTLKIKYNVKQIMIGIVLVFLFLLCYFSGFINNTVIFLILLCISLVYNLFFNKKILSILPIFKGVN